MTARPPGANVRLDVPVELLASVDAAPTAIVKDDPTISTAEASPIVIDRVATASGAPPSNAAVWSGLKPAAGMLAVVPGGTGSRACRTGRVVTGATIAGSGVLAAGADGVGGGAGGVEDTGETLTAVEAAPSPALFTAFNITWYVTPLVREPMIAGLDVTAGENACHVPPLSVEYL
jgi:hypothetical protein